MRRVNCRRSRALFSARIRALVAEAVRARQRPRQIFVVIYRDAGDKDIEHLPREF